MEDCRIQGKCELADRVSWGLGIPILSYLTSNLTGRRFVESGGKIFGCAGQFEEVKPAKTSKWRGAKGSLWVLDPIAVFFCQKKLHRFRWFSSTGTYGHDDQSPREFRYTGDNIKKL